MKRARETERRADRSALSRKSSRLQMIEFDHWREHNLCLDCQRVQPQQCELDSESPGDNPVLLERQLSDMLQGATRGCLGCHDLCVLLEGPIQEARRAAGNQKTDFRVTLTQQDYGELVLELDDGLFGRKLEACHLPITSITQKPISYPFKVPWSAESANPDSWHDYGDRLARIPRAVSSSALSDETRQIVLTWLKKCTSHELCRPPNDRDLPARVLDLKQPDAPKLVESKGMRGQYLILSHCWGAAARVSKTTRALLPKHKLRIDLDELSASFRDAIAFTTHLGYRYLWIDSLCIVQDDAEDWKIEAPQMGSYYKNATLMLSATVSPNAAAGFLHDRRVYYTVPFGKNRCYTFRKILGSTRNWDNYTLHRRAWTLQERLLAPRVLHFLSGQMLFECCSFEGFLDEGYWKNSVDELEGLQKWSLQEALEPELTHQFYLQQWPDTPEWAPYRTEGRMRTWYDIIKEYSRREMTFSTDRMPAIAGLARAVSHPSLGTYLAGLWEESLFTGLSWTVKSRLGATQPSKSYIAPSWSWLSANGNCELDENLWFFAKRGPGPGHVQEYNHWARIYAPEFVASSLRSNFGDLYDSITRGSYITVRGFCRSLHISHAPPKGPTDGPNGVVLKHVFLDHEVSEDISFYFDNPPADSKKALLLQICKGMGHNLAVYALVLVEEQKCQFRRIGLATLENYNLCGFLKVKSSGVLAGSHMHPRQRDGKEKDMKNTEWQQHRWEKRTLKLY